MRLFPINASGDTHSFDVSADGGRFLVIAPVPGASPAPTVVLNRAAELAPAR